MMKTIFLLMNLFIFVSCGKDTQLPGQRSEKVLYSAPAEREAYSYEFITKKCTTGHRAFGTLLEACDGLLDDKANNDCAFDERKELFEISKCPGSF